MPLETRAITDAEFDAWSDALDLGFYNPGKRGQGEFRRGSVWGSALADGRIFAGFDGDRVIGTLGAFRADLTVPGGAAVRVGAVSAVTVTATHRRRGVLSGLMELSLRQSVELGEAASILIPAEWPIYGRFGYGVGSEQVTVRIDASAAALLRPLPGTVDFVTPRQWAEEMPEVYERVRAATVGAITRHPQWWERTAGLVRPEGAPEDKSTLYVVYRDEAGVPRGYATYTIHGEDDWHGFRPKQRLAAKVLAESPQAQARLMQFLWEQDWIATVDVEMMSVDDTWRHFLVNPRVVAQLDRHDVLWTRILDVASALSQRTYGAEGRLVLAVEDKDGYAAGVYALEGGPDGATCTRSTESPDLTMPVQTLGSLYLGGYTASDRASVGLLTEERPGALAVADRMFRTLTSPFAATWF